MDGISEKLKLLGVNIGTEDLKTSKPQSTFPVEDVVSGRFIHTASGSIYFVEKYYPRHYLHGDFSLDINAPLKMITEWAGHPGSAEHGQESIVFLDTETSGLAGGTGTFAFMVGLGRYVDEGFQVGQFFMGDPLEESALLLAIEEYLAPYEVLVTFNGKSFDVPLLNTRYILQGWKSPLIDLFQIDLLHLARKLWRYRLPSRTLGDLEAQILNAKRTEDEVPGWMIPQMYFDYLRSRDARPLQRIFYHNEIDVLSMAALLKHTTYLIENIDRGDDLPSLDRYAIARLYEDLGHKQTAIKIYTECLQVELPEEAHLETIKRLSFVYKRLGNFMHAVELWEEAAAKGQIYAFIELAKYNEHTLRDYSEAKYWTESAINIIKAPEFPEHQRHVWLFELDHRYNRLMNKLKISSRE
jgi:uncharacterized protein YprB with RNaseH-like and TPR domain